MKITYWSDYACPYCYIGEARLKKAIESIPEMKNVQVEMKAFQLDPSAGEHAVSDTQTRFADKYGISFEAAGRQIETISQMGIAEGLDFRYASTLFTNTMDAHRLTKLAQSKGNPALTERIISALFKAYFTDNKELADKALLQSIGEACGLDAAEVREVLNSDRYRDEVISDEKWHPRGSVFCSRKVWNFRCTKRRGHEGHASKSIGAGDGGWHGRGDELRSGWLQDWLSYDYRGTGKRVF